MSSITVKQHYVPRFYLKNFGNPIFVYDKMKGQMFKSNPKNVAFEPDFYGSDNKQLPSVEKAMAELEKKMSTAVSALIEKKNFYELSQQFQKDLIMFLTMQFLRTKQVRQDIAGLVNYIVGEFLASKGQKRNAVKLSKFGETKHHLNLLADWPAFATIIDAMKFCTMINGTPIPFWTSDNPVTNQNEYDQAPWGNMGLACKGIEIHLPITPRIALVAMDPVMFREIPEVYEVYNKQHVIRENYLQLINSSRFIFSNTKKFHLVKKMLEKNQDLKDSKRTRFSISTWKGKDGKKYVMNVTDNRRPPNKGQMMGKLETWVPTEQVDKLFKYQDAMKEKLVKKKKHLKNNKAKS